MSHHQYHHQKNDYSLYGWVFLILAIVLTVGVSVYYFSSSVGEPTNNRQTISAGNGNAANQPSVNEEINENINEVPEDDNVNEVANENVSAANLNIAPDVAKSNIAVRYPQDGSIVGLPLKIQGEGREFESVVRYRVKTEKGIILADGSMQADATDVGRFGQFFVSLPLDLTSITKATVETFANSPKDGAEIDKVTNNVTIDPTLRSLEVYFSNTQSDPKAECEKVVPAIRSIAKVEKIGTASLQELLKGPTEKEKALGYFTNIPSQTKLFNFTIEGTEGRPDISADIFNKIYTPCDIDGAKLQIEKTLLQFPTIKSARILVEGKIKDSLQP